MRVPARRPRSCSASSLLAEVLFLAGHKWATGAKAPATDAIRGGARRSATTSSASPRSLFTDFLWPFEITAALLVIAVVGGGRARPPQRASSRRGAPSARTRRDRSSDDADRRRRSPPTYYLVARRDALHHRRGRPARPAQRARDVHVRRAHAQRGEPHVRVVRQRAERHPRPGDRVLRARRSPPPRSRSASASSSPSSVVAAAPPPTTSISSGTPGDLVSARDLLDLIWIVPALPLLGAVVLLLFGKRIGEPDRRLDRHRPDGARVRRGRS